MIQNQVLQPMLQTDLITALRRCTTIDQVSSAVASSKLDEQEMKQTI